jgi:23S rRNA pseudouridine1911/1915/1917 synthase
MHCVKPLEFKKEAVQNETNEKVIELEVNEERWHGVRLDVYLFSLFDEIPSRSFATKVIETGFVKLNDKLTKPSSKLAAGDKVTHDLSWQQPSIDNPAAENIPLEILFEDEHMLVINKQPGIVVHPGAGVPSGTIVNAVLFHCGTTLPSLSSPIRAGIVHRLDRDTSGVMVIAKTQKALTHLSAQFAKHSQGRKYLAIASKVPDPKQGTIETWHGRDPRNRLKFSVTPEGVGKIARMSYLTTEIFSTHGALIECELATGRTHQIRVQLTHLSCPLLGDTVYGSALARWQNFPIMFKNLEIAARRQMLHAVSLELDHPVTGERVYFVSPPPADFQSVLEILRNKKG